MKRFLLLLYISLLILPVGKLLADTVRIMTYNLENYGGTYSNNNESNKDESSRNSDYQTVIENIQPDIVIVQEIYGKFSGETRFLNDVLNHDENIFSKAFINQSDVGQDICVYYKNRMFKEYSTQLVDNANRYYRDALEVKLVHQGTGDTIIVYGVHLKAGTDSQAKRDSEAYLLRKHCNDLPANTSFIIAGDFNIYTSAESAWGRLTQSKDDNDGQVFDPINQVGNWHNNSSYKNIHTQSSRYSSGGLDDRFDMILVSNNIINPGNIDYVQSSYKSYGNDGAHFNSSVNYGGNYLVSGSVADALYNASDHLPVYTDFEFGVEVNIDKENKIPSVFTLYQNYPNPFNPSTKIEFALPIESNVKISIYDITGRLVYSLVNRKYASGIHSVQWDGLDNHQNQISSGIYFYILEAQEKIYQSKKMIFIE